MVIANKLEWSLFKSLLSKNTYITTSFNVPISTLFTTKQPQTAKMNETHGKYSIFQTFLWTTAETKNRFLYYPLRSYWKQKHIISKQHTVNKREGTESDEQQNAISA